ncbi:alcohol dehydrogenase, partial [Vibrio parahaemolyticus]
WDEAEVLTKEAIKQYRSIYNKFSQVNKMIKDLDDTVTEAMGDVNFSNINRGKKAANKKSIFLDSYRKSYQEAVTAFRRIEEIYKTFDRKV